MPNLFYLKNEECNVRGNKVVVKAAEYEQLVHAEEIILRAREMADKIGMAAKAQYRSEKEKGYASGMEQGRAEISAQIMETAVAASCYIDGLEERVADLVMKVLRKVLGAMKEDDLVCRLVRKAIDVVRNQQEITVSVHPDRVNAVRTEAERLGKDMPRNNLLEVRSDPRLALDACIVESEIGYVDGSLEVQLNAIKKAFVRELEKRRQSSEISLPAAQHRGDMRREEKMR